MEISPEEIERIAAAGYSPRQTAFLLGLKPAEFIAAVKDETSDISIAYFKGFFSSELSIRESVMQLARSGSSPAQASSLNIFNETKRRLAKDDFPGFDE